MPDFRRGMAAMQEAQESQRATGSSPYPTFCRPIQWREDREEKFVVFLNRASDIPTVELHTFVPVGTGTSKAGKAYTRYEEFISRKDPAIGEDTDDLQDRLGKKPQLRGIAVAVELEPTYSTVNGRKRPTGFQVKTETYNRKSESGDVEEVEAPCIGIIEQSPLNFFNWLGSFDESTAPIEDTPLQVTRQGKDANTAYNFVPYMDQKIDYSNLFELVDGVAYLRGELDDIDLSVDDSDDDEATRNLAVSIGEKFLSKRLNELADGERYERLVSPIEEIEDRFGGSAKDNGRPAPQKRASQRSASKESAPRNTAKFDELRKMHEAA